MMVEMIAGTCPIRKKMTAGIKYTKAGMVCIRSSAGRSTAFTGLDEAESIPSGMPKTRAITDALIISAKVDCVADQSPMDSMNSMPIKLKSARPFPALR